MRWVYRFGGGKAEGGAKNKDLLGYKGANLGEMSSLGIPVPAGFTISTEVCTYYYANNRTYPPDLKEQVYTGLAQVETIMGAKFGATEGPLLLVSVRSGARASMAGMMDTVLNLGLNDQTVLNLARNTGDERFTYDSYRRFIQMYSDVVLNVGNDNFEYLFEQRKEKLGKNYDVELTPDDWKALISQYKNEVRKHLGKDFPQEPHEQLWGAIGAVLGSWMNRRAITYRKLNNIPDHWGTAVNVQAMVFGNMGDDSATGVCFSRNPSTGENLFYGEYLVNAQGEDVTAGIRTPQPLSLAEKAKGSDLPAMEEVLPSLYRELVGVGDRLERHYRDMQDMEFTIQKGKLWILGSRTGKRTVLAALRMAVEMCKERLIDKNTAIKRVDPASLSTLVRPMIDPAAKKEMLGQGHPASGGVASGQIVFTADLAEEWAKGGRQVILVRIEVSPDDLGGMHVADGILTTEGGMTSHAAVISRGMGTPCVAGAGNLIIDYTAKTLKAGDMVLKEGDWITLDGYTGQVFNGKVEKVMPALTGNFKLLMDWAKEVSSLMVRASVRTLLQSSTARNFECDGVCVFTEPMFLNPDRVKYLHYFILAETDDERQSALANLLPYQRRELIEFFTIMDGLPVTICLFDAPLYEMLAQTAEVAEAASAEAADAVNIRARAQQLYEANPMLGHRGCRLGITNPELYEMQTRAIFEAAVNVAMKGRTVLAEVMLPMIATKGEFDRMKELVIRVASEVMSETGIKLEFTVGAMIQLPRAALIAHQIAEGADFFIFGTEDLTQTTYGVSLSDAAYLTLYQELAILPNDPFKTIDHDGVGELVQIACNNGRRVNPDIKLGLCGAHASDQASVYFCRMLGLDYISCSPHFVPVAQLAAARAELGARDAATA